MVKFDNSKYDTKEIGMVNLYLKDKTIVKFMQETSSKYLG